MAPNGDGNGQARMVRRAKSVAALYLLGVNHLNGNGAELVREKPRPCPGRSQ